MNGSPPAATAHYRGRDLNPAADEHPANPPADRHRRAIMLPSPQPEDPQPNSPTDGNSECLPTIKLVRR